MNLHQGATGVLTTGVLVLSATIGTQVANPQAPGAAGIEADIDALRAIVIEAADGVSWKPAPEGVTDYLTIIAPVLDTGQAAIPGLEAVSTDPRLSPWQQRIAWLIAHRIRRPDVFEEFDRFLESFTVGPPQVPRPGVLEIHVVGHWDLPPNMMDQNTRRIVEQYPELVQMGREMRDEYVFAQDGVRQSAPQEKVGRFDMRMWHQAMIRLFDEQRVPRNDRAGIIDLALTQPIRTSPKYLPAWEEAVIREVDVRRRIALMNALVEQDEPESAIVLGELSRRAVTADPQVFRSKAVSPTVFSLLLGRAFQRWPSAVTLREVIHMLEYEDAHTHALNLSRSILKPISRSEKWAVFLEQALNADDRQLANDAATIVELTREQ